MDPGTILALVIGILVLVTVPVVGIMVYCLVSSQLKRLEGIQAASVPPSQSHPPALVPRPADLQYTNKDKQPQVPQNQVCPPAMLRPQPDAKYAVEERYPLAGRPPSLKRPQPEHVQYVIEEERQPQDNNFNSKQKSLGEGSHAFTHAEIVEITENFRKRIGKGRSAVVYYGRLKDGREVAVKVLDISFPQGAKEFVSEVQILLTVHHKCIAVFFGYCNEGRSLILVYEYLKGGTLRELLSGLDYLHSSCLRPIIHRDVKTANILLNEHLEAKIPDFGLCKEGFDDNATYVSTIVAGTPGYIDPEYFLTSRLTKKSDVYSFGVILLELISGQSAFFTGSNGHHFNLVLWAKPLLEGKDIESVADTNLKGKYNVESIWKVANIAAACTAEVASLRPTMAEVVRQLQEALEVQTGNQSADSTSSTAGFSPMVSLSRRSSTHSGFKEIPPASTSTNVPSTRSTSTDLLPSASASSVGPTTSSTFIDVPPASVIPSIVPRTGSICGDSVPATEPSVGPSTNSDLKDSLPASSSSIGNAGAVSAFNGLLPASPF